MLPKHCQALSSARKCAHRLFTRLLTCMCAFLSGWSGLQVLQLPIVKSKLKKLLQSAVNKMSPGSPPIIPSSEDSLQEFLEAAGKFFGKDPARWEPMGEQGFWPCMAGTLHIPACTHRLVHGIHLHTCWHTCMHCETSPAVCGCYAACVTHKTYSFTLHPFLHAQLHTRTNT